MPWHGKGSGPIPDGSTTTNTQTLFQNKGLVLSSLFVGLLIGIGIERLEPSSVSVTSLRQANHTYKFINPLLGIDTPEQIGLVEYKDLREKIQASILQKIREKDAEKVSVYFRKPSTGEWFSINGTEKYTPASLLKIPLMMAYFKQAESDPTILTKEIFYDAVKDYNASESFPSKELLAKNKYYSVDELIAHMIRYSDNNATELLNKNIQSNLANEVYYDLVNDPLTVGHDFIGIKDYVLFIRVLYNATYLSRDMSEKALGLLSETDFAAGLRAGVPKDTPVAHKFGEFSSTPSASGYSSVRELHDCGIIYSKSSPYILCVMTKGTNLNDLAATIATISKIVFEDISKK